MKPEDTNRSDWHMWSVEVAALVYPKVLELTEPHMAGKNDHFAEEVFAELIGMIANHMQTFAGHKTAIESVQNIVRELNRRAVLERMTEENNQDFDARESIH